MAKREITRLRSVSKLAVLARNSGEFDAVFYKGCSGCQPGAWVEVMKDQFRTLLRVERTSLGEGEGYGATKTGGSRIGYLSIRYESRYYYYGTWDPNELVQRPRHNFDNDPEPVRALAGLVIKYFSK